MENQCLYLKLNYKMYILADVFEAGNIARLPWLCHHVEYLFSLIYQYNYDDDNVTQYSIRSLQLTVE